MAAYWRSRHWLIQRASYKRPWSCQHMHVSNLMHINGDYFTWSKANTQIIPIFMNQQLWPRYNKKLWWKERGRMKVLTVHVNSREKSFLICHWNFFLYISEHTVVIYIKCLPKSNPWSANFSSTHQLLSWNIHWLYTSSCLVSPARDPVVCLENF